MLTQNGKKKYCWQVKNPHNKCWYWGVCALLFGPQKEEQKRRRKNYTAKASTDSFKRKGNTEFLLKKNPRKVRAFAVPSRLILMESEVPGGPRKTKELLASFTQTRRTKSTALRLTHHNDCNHIQNTLNAFPNVRHGTKTKVSAIPRVPALSCIHNGQWGGWRKKA